MAIRWKPDDESKKPKLITLAEYNALTPYRQGYTYYYQASWPDSPIPETGNTGNPYAEGTIEAEHFRAGNYAALAHMHEPIPFWIKWWGLIVAACLFWWYVFPKLIRWLVS